MHKFFKQNLSFAIRFVKSYFIKGRFIPQEIPKLSIETTNSCDAKCVFCANNLMKRKREPLDMDLFKKAVDDFAAMGGTYIDFNTIIGEPLLDSYLLERARYVKQFSQLKILGFVTNLQWLHKFDMDDFFNCGINWLEISTVLSGRQKYFEFFGVDRYEQTLKNIVMLIKENKKRGNKMALGFSIKPTNEPLKAVISHPDFRMVSSLLAWDISGAIKNQGLYVDDWVGCVKLPSYLKKRPLYLRAFRPCGLLYAKLIIFSNGNIGACSCRDFEANSGLVLGNAKNITLKEAWQGERLVVIRSDWRRINKIPDICRHCRHYVY